MVNSIIHEIEMYLSQGKGDILIQSNVADCYNMGLCIRLCQQTGPELS